jgi:hypothetical protein
MEGHSSGYSQTRLLLNYYEVKFSEW